MPITGHHVPGARAVRFELDPRTALDIWFALAASLQAEETTSVQRATVAGMLPQFKRAIVATGFVTAQFLEDYQRHLATKPAPPPLDVIVRKIASDL